MTSQPKPRRSVLYVPATSAGALAKARQLDCDAVIVDLEDSVAPDRKDEARAAAVADVAAGGFGHRDVIVRVNALETPWGADDLAAVAALPIAAVLAPKVSNATDVLAYEARLGAAGPDLRLWVMIETAASSFRLEEIAAAARHGRLGAFVLGTNDLAKEIGAKLRPDRLPFLAILAAAVAAGHAHGLSVIDGVFNDLDDVGAFEAQCRQAVDFGFDGKTLIHPRQIDPCNRIFAPSTDDLRWAHTILATFDAPENAGKGALRVEGRMVERLHLVDARKLVAMDAALRLRADEDVAA